MLKGASLLVSPPFKMYTALLFFKIGKLLLNFLVKNELIFSVGGRRSNTPMGNL